MRRLPIILGLLSFSLLGCDRGPSESTRRVYRFPVETTVYPLADLARQVAGEAASVNWVAEAGQTLEHYVPPAGVRDRFRLARFILLEGDEIWAGAGERATGSGDRLIRLDATSAARDRLLAGREEGALWLDPIIMAEATETLADRLAVHDPGQAAIFRERADALSRALRQPVTDFENLPADERLERVIVLTPEPAALLDRLDVDWQLAPEWTPQAVRRIAERNKIDALLLTTELGEAAADDWARQTGLPVRRYEPLGSSAAAAPRGDVLSLTRWNVNQLRRSPDDGTTAE